MVDEWVVETLQHIAGKLLQFLNGQVEGLHQFFELNLVDILADDIVLTGITHNVDAAEECNGRENGVRTIEKCDFTLMVRLL